MCRLDSYWQPACISAWTLFIIYQTLIGYDKFANPHSLCPHDDYSYPMWYWYSCFGVLGAFVFVWIALLTKISNIQSAQEKTPHLIAFNIVSMGTLATVFALVLDWGGICIDVLGCGMIHNLLSFTVGLIIPFS